MKRILCPLILLVAAGPTWAQESAEDEINLVRHLRAKGWNDLARARIDFLLKRGDPALAAALPIELARINIAEARQKGPEERFALFTAARKQLQEFVDKNKGKADAALASAELARVTSYYGQALLSKAMREEDDKTRHEKARPAEAMFIQAGKELEGAVAAIDAASKDPANVKIKPLLDRELKQVRFDIAINIFDQARTYINRGSGAVNEIRANTMKKASDEFLKLRSDEASQVGWLANAWLMKTAMEMQTPGDVKKYYTQVMKRKDDKAVMADIQPAVRLVRYFHLQDITVPRDDPETIGNYGTAPDEKTKLTKKPRERLHEVQAEGEAWLKAYPNSHKTYEGQGVRFELATAYYTEARMEAGEKKPNAKTLETLYGKAVEHFDELSKADGDLAERARMESMQIQYTVLKTTTVELKTFDQFFMKGMMERMSVRKASAELDKNAKEMAEAAGDKLKLEKLEEEKKSIDADRKKHLKEVIGALNKALGLADNKTPVPRIDEARFLLCGAYLTTGDAYRGAIVAEALARGRTSKSADGAAQAIATYASMLSRDKKNAILRQRLFEIGDLVLAEKNWTADSVTSLAHYHLAMAVRTNEAIEEAENKAIKALEEKKGKMLTDKETGEIKEAIYHAKNKEAIGHLEKIDTNFVDFNYTQGQLVFIAEAAVEKVEDKKERKWYNDAARRAIERMKKLNPKEDSPSVITMYYFAKLELAKYLYAEAFEELNNNEELKAVKKCTDMKKYVLELRSDFDKLPGQTISKENRDRLEFTMGVMLKYADLGIAETKFRSDRKERFDEVIEATKKVVDDMVALGKKTPAGETIKLQDYSVTGKILGLALRAHVQKGGGSGVEKGKAILDVLNRLGGLEENEKPGNVVGSLLRDISGQIEAMKKRNDKKALDATKQNYTAFLDEIAKEYDKKGNDTASTMMLANAYKSLGDYPKAANLYSKFPVPKTLDKKVVKKKDETDAELKERQAWEEEVTKYWGVQLEYIRTLRATKDKDSIATAEKAIETLLKHPAAKYKIQTMMEKNLLFEDLGDAAVQAKKDKTSFNQDDIKKGYRFALKQWGDFVKQPAITGPNLQNKDVQEIYFKGVFYATRVRFKLGAYDVELKNPQSFIDGAARDIYRLESSKDQTGWGIVGPMFMELLKDKDYEKLKKAYDALKGETPKKGSSLGDPPRGDLQFADDSITNPERKRRDGWVTCETIAWHPVIPSLALGVSDFNP